jgi:hypothetical protein
LSRIVHLLAEARVVDGHIEFLESDLSLRLKV